MSPASRLPLVAIVGRTNVGKSTLFNRITGKRRALVSREPGMTRDRRMDAAEWRGRHFVLVDTGGLEGGTDFLSKQISSQAAKAIHDATLVLMLVDGRRSLTAQDQEIASFLRRSDRPVVLLVNKMDSPRSEPEPEVYSLGFPQVFSVSAEHGLGVDEVLDHLIERLQLEPSNSLEEKPAISAAILGKPNVGKSTFLNQLVGQERLVVSELPGTTRDTIVVEVVHKGRLYRFIDTAGIRKKGATRTVPDKLAVIHARKSLDRADVACVMIDASEGVTHQDAVIAGYTRDAGKAILILLNKIDLLQPPGRKQLEMEVESKLKFISFAPRLYISAKTGQNLGKVFPKLGKIYESYSKRITTGSLNSFFDRVLSDRYIGSFKGKLIKLKYITQVGIRPPTFILFTNAASRLHFSQLRYLENQLRSHFGFEGTTIRIRIRRA